MESNCISPLEAMADIWLSEGISPTVKLPLLIPVSSCNKMGQNYLYKSVVDRTSTLVHFLSKSIKGHYRIIIKEVERRPLTSKVPGSSPVMSGS